MSSMDQKKISTKALLRALHVLAEFDSVEELARQGITRICEELGATHGKLLAPSDRNPGQLAFWHGYPEGNSFWTEERRRLCNVPILPFDKQRTLPREKRSLVGHVLSTGDMIILENIKQHQFKDFYLDLGDAAGSEIVAAVKTFPPLPSFALCLAHDTPGYFTEEYREQYANFCILLGELFCSAFRHEEMAQNTAFYRGLFSLDWHTQVNTAVAFNRIVGAIRDRFKAGGTTLCVFSCNHEFLCQLGSAGQTPYDGLFAHHWCKLEELPMPESVRQALTSTDCLYQEDNTGTLYVRIPDPFSAGAHPGRPALASPHFGFIGIFDPQIKVSPKHREDLCSHVVSAVHSILFGMQHAAIQRVRNAIWQLTMADLSTAEGPIGALDRVISSTGYSTIHVWKREGSRLRLVLPLAYTQARSGKNYTVQLKKQCRVTRVCHDRQPHFSYGLNLSTDVLFPEIIPQGVVSWLGFPVLAASDDGRPIGVISCFDRDPPGSAESLLSRIDLSILDILSTVVLLAHELEKATAVSIGRKGIQSHELSVLLGCLRANVDVLYQRIQRPDTALPVIEYSGQLGAPRDDATVYEGIEVFFDTIYAYLTRDRIIEGQWKPTLTDYSLNKIVASTVSMMRVILRRKTWFTRDVSIEYEDFRGQNVRTDVSALREVLLNLLTNAVKYSDPGTQVWIRNAGSGKMRICNRGIGIPEADLPYIFDKGYRGSNTASCDESFAGPGEGFADKGIGLYIVQRFITALQGRVEVVSRGTPNEDTIFEVTLAES